MKYQCVKCGGVWGEGDPLREGYSHGLCSNCLIEQLIPLYRRRQGREGNPDCFRKSLGNCHQTWCAYHKWCVAPEQALEPDPEKVEYVAAGSHVSGFVPSRIRLATVDLSVEIS